MGVPNILGFVARECRKVGVPIFFVATALLVEKFIIMLEMVSASVHMEL